MVKSQFRSMIFARNLLVSGYFRDCPGNVPWFSIFPMKFQVLPQVLDPSDREVMNLIKVMNHIKATPDPETAMWVKRT